MSYSSSRGNGQRPKHVLSKAPSLKPLKAYLALCRLNHTNSDIGADITDALNARIDEVVRYLFGGERVSKTQRRRLDHAVCHGGCTSQNSTEPQTYGIEMVV